MLHLLHALHDDRKVKNINSIIFFPIKVFHLPKHNRNSIKIPGCDK